MCSHSGRCPQPQRAGDVRAALRRAHGRRGALHVQHAARRGHGVRPAEALRRQGVPRRVEPPRRRESRVEAPRRVQLRRPSGPAHHLRRHRLRRLRGSRQERPRPVRHPVAGGRAGPDLAQLHVRHDVAAQGRGVQPPRRVPQHHRHGARVRHHRHADVPVDRAHVPLQRLEPAVGRRHAGRHQRMPPPLHRRGHLRQHRAARRDAHGRRAHGAEHDRQRAARGPDAAAGARPRHDGRRAAAAARPVRGGGARLRGVPHLRPHGDVRPGDRVHVDARVGRAAGGAPRAAQGAAGVPPHRDAGRGRQEPNNDGVRAARRRDGGRGDVPRQHRDERLLQGPEGDQGVDGRRVAAHRGPRRAAPRRVHRAQGPGQGHHHLGRREHQLHRGGVSDLQPPCRPRGGGRGAARRPLGRDAVRVRQAQGRRQRHGSGDHKLLPGEAAPLHGAQDGGVRGYAQDFNGEDAEVCSP